ncbi:MAG: hypothetical protein FWC16_14945 [Defluviitaleaceae bacterium]|nr:hypothetical protein [Defluviitaleaceae bacterium]MCL2276213.1 hypothetical protein [Defluviitaleaceae bacterium]
MKQKIFLGVVLTFLLLLLASCATVTVTNEANLRVGNQSSNYETEAISTTAQLTADNDMQNRSWANRIVFIVGIPLSVLGVITLIIIIREVHKRKI